MLFRIKYLSKNSITASAQVRKYPAPCKNLLNNKLAENEKLEKNKKFLFQ